MHIPREDGSIQQHYDPCSCKFGKVGWLLTIKS